MVYLLMLLPVLLGFLTLMVDYGLMNVVKSQLETAVDAAALAAANGMGASPANARALAKSVAAANTVNLRPLTLLDSDIEFGTWDSASMTFTLLTGSNESSANSVRITGRMRSARGTDVKLFFLPLLQGASSLEMTNMAVARGAGDQSDFVMIQDLSGSFTAELPTAKTGDQDLLSSLNTPGTQSTFALVGFTGWGKTISTLQPVSTSYNAITSAISSLSINGSGMPPTGTGSDIAAGIEQAQAIFNASPQPTHSRSMIIVSDGQPNGSSQGSHPLMSDNQLVAQAQQDADTAWSKGINVFVIWWDSSNGADLTSGANLQSLVRGKGQYIHVTDPSLLSTAIKNVLSGQAKLVK
jgi:Flp pilus assembly protein TadG/Mg-chelatase subunit ChlD